MAVQWKYFFAGLLMVVPIGYGLWRNIHFTWFQPKTIKIGILHPMTGPMGGIERETLNAELLAIADINRAGGVLGRILEPVVMDTKSQPPLAPLFAEQLVTEHRVDLLLGLWYSAARKKVKEVAERHGVLYLFTASYEGCEQSPHMLYTGVVSNQQVIPALAWMAQNLGREIYLVGPRDVYGEVMHHIIRRYAPLYGVTILGEERLADEASDFSPLIAAIRAAKPRCILSTLSGDASCAFFQQVYDQRLGMPIVATHTSSAELLALRPEVLAGNYLATSYLSGIESKQNQAFLARVHGHFGAGYKMGSPQESAYTGITLWAHLAQRAGSPAATAVRAQLAHHVSIAAPAGVVFFDKESQHLYQVGRIGYIEKDGTVTPTWTSRKPIKPQPYPQLAPAKYWEEFLAKLFASWGEKWAQPQGKGTS